MKSRKFVSALFIMVMILSIMPTSFVFADTSDASWTDDVTQAPATGYVMDGDIVTITSAE